MSYCDRITAEKVYRMNELELNHTLDGCENCPRYSLCDTVALMHDELKVKQGEILKCPYCGRYQEFCDCPDLFYVDVTRNKEWTEQEKLMAEINSCGYNIVTCGHCGQVFIHRI